MCILRSNLCGGAVTRFAKEALRTASRKMEEWSQLLFPPRITSKALVRQALPVSQMGHGAWVPGTGFMLGSVHLGEKGKELEAQFQLWAGSSWKGPAVGDYTFS